MSLLPYLERVAERRNLIRRSGARGHARHPRRPGQPAANGRFSDGHADEGRDGRRSWWASRAPCAKWPRPSITALPAQPCSIPAAPAATAPARSTSPPSPPLWWRARACAWPSTATAPFPRGSGQRRPAGIAGHATSHLSPAESARAIREVGIGFLFAPHVHTAMKHANPVRVDLKMRTFFNLLGPLTNPAGATAQLAGAPSEQAGRADRRERWRRSGLERGFVVHGSDGLDEITTTGPTLAFEIRDGRVERRTLEPEDFAIHRAVAADLKGGDHARNLRNRSSHFRRRARPAPRHRAGERRRRAGGRRQSRDLPGRHGDLDCID